MFYNSRDIFLCSVWHNCSIKHHHPWTVECAWRQTLIYKTRENWKGKKSGGNEIVYYNWALCNYEKMKPKCLWITDSLTANQQAPPLVFSFQQNHLEGKTFIINSFFQTEEKSFCLKEWIKQKIKKDFINLTFPGHESWFTYCACA